MNEKVYFTLLRDDTISATTEPAGGVLDHVNLLQREIGLEKSVLTTKIELNKWRLIQNSDITLPKISNGNPIKAIILL